MKITFKVSYSVHPRIQPGAESLHQLQDLKQNKFVIEAEPSETVCEAPLPTNLRVERVADIHRRLATLRARSMQTRAGRLPSRS